MAWEVQAEVPGGFADEAGLVDGLRAGRSEAFEALHAAYAARIYNLALRIVDDPEDAQDVAQEVLLKVFRGVPGDETRLNLPAWLYRVTVNASFDHIRASKRRPVTVAEADAPEAPAVIDEYERSELVQRVESTLRELPKRQQLALVLRDVHGLSVGETASVLGLKKGSADVLLSRARAGFRRVFLAGAGSLTGRCDRADKALADGIGRGNRVPASLLQHSTMCPDCRRAVELWGAAPVGLGLLLPQVALPAKLSLGATLAAAQAVGIAAPAGLGAAGASAGGAAAAGTLAASAAEGAAAGVTAGAAGAGAGAASGGGLIAALGSATGVKIATLAAVATATVGIAGVTTQDVHAPADEPGPAAAKLPAQGGRHASRAALGGAHGSDLSRGEQVRPQRAPRGEDPGREASDRDGKGASRPARGRDPEQRRHRRTARAFSRAESTRLRRGDAGRAASATKDESGGKGTTPGAGRGPGSGAGAGHPGQSGDVGGSGAGNAQSGGTGGNGSAGGTLNPK
jgi:RNA polymerase sigma factor (sigma-70 family)